MRENVKYGLLLALERDLGAYLEFAKARPNGWLDGPDANEWKGDARNLVEALDWLLAQSMPKYVNMGSIRRDLELLKEKL